MSHRLALDPTKLEKLRKVWAMCGSAHAGERDAAERKAVEIVAPFGYAIHHVEQLLATNGAPISAAWEENWKQKQREENNKRYQHEDYQERHKQWLSRREAIIRRYGSLEAAEAWQPREKLLRQAVAHLCDVEADSLDWAQDLDGWSDGIDDQPPRRIIELVSQAYTLPTSITQAQAEFDYWEERGGDWEAILPCHRYYPSDPHLDLPALLRHQIVTKLLATGLRAASIGEILLRQRHVMALQDLDEIQNAILQDLEYLASTEVCTTVQNGRSTNFSGPHQTTKQRRADVERLLSNMDTRSLADREIARRLGVSPQTVGNIRRRLIQTANHGARWGPSLRID